MKIIFILAISCLFTGCSVAKNFNEKGDLTSKRIFSKRMKPSYGVLSDTDPRTSVLSEFPRGVQVPEEVPLKVKIIRYQYDSLGNLRTKIKLIKVFETIEPGRALSPGGKYEIIKLDTITFSDKKLYQF